MLIQFLIIAVVLVVTASFMRTLPGEKSLALKRALSILFAIAAVIAVLFPELLSEIAIVLGVGRGTDLLLYGSIMAGMIFAVMVIRAKARSDARVTNLARAVALMEARQEDQNQEDSKPL